MLIGTCEARSSEAAAAHLDVGLHGAIHVEPRSTRTCRRSGLVSGSSGPRLGEVILGRRDGDGGNLVRGGEGSATARAATATRLANGRLNGRDRVLARLDAVGGRDEGPPQARRPGARRATEKARRDVVGRLAELERRAVDDLAGLQPGTARHREVAARARQWLAEARVAAQHVLTDPRVRAACTRPWRSRRCAATSNGSARSSPGWTASPPCPERLARRRARAAARPAGSARRPASRRARRRARARGASRCRRRCWSAASAASWPGRSRDAGPERLWVHRFQLSRLQAHVAALDQTPDGDRTVPTRLAGGRRPRRLARGPASAAAASWPTRPTSGWPPCRPRDRREPCSAPSRPRSTRSAR